jgi:transposase
VSRWYESWRRRGKIGLAGAGRAGRKSKLTQRQIERLKKTLRQGPRAHGFETDLWTLPRVATVIERVMKVRYHPAHVWRILGRIEWSLQRPAKQARERDAEKVKLWKETRWPELKKSCAATRLDLLPRRERGLREAVNPEDLGPERGNSGPDPFFQLEQRLGECRDRIPLGRASEPVDLPDH